MIAAIVSHEHTTRRAEAFVPVAVVGDTLPDVPLVDQFARPLSLRFGGRATVLAFAYTRCPDRDGCDLVTAKFARLRTLFAGSDIRLVEVTLDPQYDTPTVLRRYAEAVGSHDASWSFATGATANVETLAKRLGIVETRRAGAIEHTESVAILSPRGRLLDRIDGAQWSPRDVVAQARSDAGLTADPVRTLALGLFARAGAVCGAAAAGGPSALTAFALLAGLVVAFGYIALRVFASFFGGPSL